uniref:Uncharacterized protein n=1 Tax=Podoviridae sp. ct8mF2 TaxID=2825224 RepID=A0A8S5PMQ8_9CAUD|nr:MAG TPA: hypothetical protein [Podoviridae sp. ct8mF2]
MSNAHSTSPVCAITTLKPSSFAISRARRTAWV